MVLVVDILSSAMASDADIEEFQRLTNLLGVQFCDRALSSYGDILCGLSQQPGGCVLLAHGSGRAELDVGSAMDILPKKKCIIILLKNGSGNPECLNLSETLQKDYNLALEQTAHIRVFRLFYRQKEIQGNLNSLLIPVLRELAEGVNPIDPIEEQILRLDLASLPTEHLAQLRTLLEKTLGKL